MAWLPVEFLVPFIYLIPPSLPGDGAIRQHPYCKYERMFWECFQTVSEQRNEKWIFEVQRKGNKGGRSKPHFNAGGSLFFMELVKLWVHEFSDWKKHMFALDDCVWFQCGFGITIHIASAGHTPQRFVSTSAPIPKVVAIVCLGH